jgi:nitrogen fixation protein FixH
MRMRAMTTHHPGTGDGRRTKEVTGRMVLICFVAFFAVVAGVNAIMIRAAVSTFGGVEMDNAYQAGLAFAREIAAAQAQDALHWDVRAKVSAGATATDVEVSAVDATGARLTGLEASARLVHPADKRSDHVVALREAGRGRFIGSTDVVAGQWELVLELSRDGTRVFRSRNRVFMR